MSEFLEWYTSFSIRVAAYATAIGIGSAALAGVASAVILGLWFFIVRAEKWAAFFGLAYAFTTLQYLSITWLGHENELSLLSNAIIQALLIIGAREAVVWEPGWKDRTKWFLSFFALGLLVYGIEVSGFLAPFHRVLSASFACGCLGAANWALFWNLREAKGFGPFKWVAAGTGIGYGLLFLFYACHTYWGNLSVGFEPLAAFPRARTELPIIDSMDFNILFGMFFLKGTMFLCIFLLLVRTMLVLSPNPTLFRNITHDDANFLDPYGKSGILSMFGESVGADQVAICYLRPGNSQDGKKKYIWYSWFSKNLRNLVMERDEVEELNKLSGVYPIVWPGEEREKSAVEVVFKENELHLCEDLEKTHNVQYSPYFSGFRSFVNVPVYYQGGLIAVLNFEWLKPRAFSPTGVRRMEQLANLISPVIQARRQQLLALRLPNRLNKIPYKPWPGFALPVLLQLLDLLGVEAVLLIVRIGFKRFLIAKWPNNLQIIPLQQNNKDLKKKMRQMLLELGPVTFKRSILKIKVDKEPRRLRIGQLILAVKSERDAWHKPSLCRERLTRMGVCAQVTDRLLKNFQTQIESSLSWLQVRLTGDIKDTDWMTAVARTIKKVGGCWTLFEMAKGEKQASHLLHEDDESLIALLKERADEAAIQFFPLESPHHKALSVVRLVLKEPKAHKPHATLWMGFEPKSLEKEFREEALPWFSFFTRLKGISEVVLTRMEVEKLKQDVARWESSSLQSLIQKLWFHELGNMAAELTSSAGIAKEAFYLEQPQIGLEKLDQVKALCGDFSKVTASLRKSFRTNDDRMTFPLLDVVRVVRDNYQVLLSSKKIHLHIDVAADLLISMYYPVAYLAIGNLVANGIKAIKRNGLIRIEAVENDQHVTCSVIDNGPGVPDHLHRKIFELGFSSVEGHSGMGLPGSRKALRGFGGDLFLNTACVEGARFDIRFSKFTKESKEATYDETRSDR